MSDETKTSESLYKLYLCCIKSKFDLRDDIIDMISAMNISDIFSMRLSVTRLSHFINVGIRHYLVSLGFSERISSVEIVDLMNEEWRIEGSKLLVGDRYTYAFSELQKKGDLVLFRLVDAQRSMLMSADKEFR